MAISTFLAVPLLWHGWFCGLQDRWWRNMSAAIDRLKAQGREPTTGQEFLDVFPQYGFNPVTPFTAAQKASAMTFPDVMEASCGFSILQKYPAKGEPEAPAKCDACKKQGG
jgi:hypothetical protein